MSSDSPALLKLTTQLADGEPLDWQLADQLDPTLREQLRQLELLAGGFGTDPATTSAGDWVEAVEMLRAGEKFGPLKVVGELGQGSFGRVYRAHDPELNREVALKLIDPRGRSRLDILREARLLARVNHPNVLKVYGALEDRGRIGLAFELVEGQSMQQWLASQSLTGAHSLVAIGLELASAICALHQVGVVHGDLKPANILRHPSGRWIVADLGSGRRIGEIGMSAGTPRYMAPELFDQGEPSAASDQYALGVVLFRLASGEFPVDGADPAAIAIAHQKNLRLRLLDVRPDLPLALIDAVERAMAIEPDQRFGSVGQFAAALSAVIAGPALAPSRPRYGLAAAALAASVGLLALFWRILAPAPAELSEVRWLAFDDSGVRALQLGDSLHLDQGLTLELQLPEATYVHVFNQDQAGHRFQLFPLQTGDLHNPLPPGQHRLPGRVGGETVDWRLSSSGGREYFLLVLSDQPIPELSAFALAESGSENAALLAMQEPVRGVGGLQARAGNQPVDWSWLNPLRTRYPKARFEAFELEAP